jgi:hypothetical protein
LGAIPAIVLGFIALQQMKGSGDRGRGLAIAGIVIGVLWVVIYAIGLTVEATR